MTEKHTKIGRFTLSADDEKVSFRDDKTNQFVANYYIQTILDDRPIFWRGLDLGNGFELSVVEAKQLVFWLNGIAHQTRV